MASSSSASEINNSSTSPEPGPLMRLLLNAKDQSPSQPTPLEKKEPEKDLNWYLPLYKASLQGDWESAREFFNRDPDAVTAKITHSLETVLHIAVGTVMAINFVKELLELIQPEILPSLRDQAGQTPLHYAAIFGNVEAAKLLVNRSPAMTNAPSNTGFLPIHLAAGYANKDAVSYLLTVTRDDIQPNPFRDESGAELLNLMIIAEFYDLALYMIQLYPGLATAKSPAGNSALSIIARKDLSVSGGSSVKIWETFLYSPYFWNLYEHPKRKYPDNPDIGCQSCARICCCIRKLNFCGLSVVPSYGQKFIEGCQKLQAAFWKIIVNLVPHVRDARETKFMHLQALQLVRCLCTEVSKLDYATAASFFQQPIIVGASFGNNVIVEEILHSFPPAIWSRNHEGHNIFMTAVANRREGIFNLLYQMSGHKRLALRLVDNKMNNILHLAGKLAPTAQLNLVSGAALQMQRELQWYKEVEKHVLPESKAHKNSSGRTPAVEFSVEHKDLVKEGEKWMKDAANSCTVSATLIATIAFAASITVPGGNNGDTGSPIFSNDLAFNIFAAADALSLFSSTASLLMFLSILTARYAEVDFLYSLPRRLIIGLVTLFISITTMMIAFSATIYLVFGDKRAWTIVPIAAIACLPVTLFATLQFPLLMDMIRSTYCPGCFGKRSEDLLF
ncbi:uncharacterized protein [Coffea arabica]|uniref:Uncharacterized protein isoform X2 n=1 Tax=Coffea arabica TaxID=13443 RepID=A0A6P6SJ27_COFAR|nr:uncharacterized protein LOC113691558 isoform X2 [Coffea arabica]